MSDAYPGGYNPQGGSQQAQSVPAWVPLSVQDTTSIIGVTPTPVKRVLIRYADGQTTTLDIPVADYTVQRVQQAGDAAAETHFRVMALEGRPIPVIPE